VALRQLTSSALTVDRPAPPERTEADIAPVLEALVQASAKDTDPTLSFLIWMAAEPLVAADSFLALEWLGQHGPQTLPLSEILVRKAVRRICDTQERAKLDEILAFLDTIVGPAPRLAQAALDGLIEAQQGRAILPNSNPGPLLTKLAGHSDRAVVERAQRLGTLWGDAEAIRRVLSRVADPAQPESDRIQAIRSVRQTKTEATREALFNVVRSSSTDPVRVEAVRALGEVGGERIAEGLIAAWPQLSPAVRRAACETMILRGKWKVQFVEAVDAGQILAGEVPITVVRSLSKEPELGAQERIARAFGKFRESDADKVKLIAAKRQMVLSGQPNLEAGHEVARKTCFVCHKLHGEGAEVGPDLTGVGRSSLDALLANVIDPNQIIGKGYENVEIETKDGRTLSGRVVENTDVRVSLLSSGPKEDVVAKADIASYRVSEISVMPEGLEQMPDADFRNLVWFILNPPGDGKPLDAQRRRELVGDETAVNAPARDGESVALWNPDWRLSAPDFEGTPIKLAEFAGRKNVLKTHPFDASRAAAFERVMDVPAAPALECRATVASDERGDFELRFVVDNTVVQRTTIDRKGETWKTVRLDLTPYAGRKIVLRVENAANGWSWEFGYWGELTLAPKP